MNLIPTIGIDKFYKEFQLSDGTYAKCYIYDTAGQERYAVISIFMSREYFRKILFLKF
jgi:hypothetical protein